MLTTDQQTTKQNQKYNLISVGNETVDNDTWFRNAVLSHFKTFYCNN